MKNKIFFFSALCSIPAFCQIFVTQEVTTGRFGDQILSYMHAKYIAYKYNLPLLYRDFPYADELRISEKETKNTYKKSQVLNVDKNNFNYISEVLKSDDFLNNNAILQISYFPEDRFEISQHPGYLFFEVEWDNQDFKKSLRETISPKNPLKLIDVPDNKISVALHVRLGGSYSNDRININKIPLKFPPISFYSKGLQRILDLLGDEKEYYVYIFTDEDSPKELMDYFRKKFPQKNITFDCRFHGNTHDCNVLEDFFSMAQFDCSVHPLSNYSICAAKIADYLVEIEPLEFAKKDNRFIITKDRVTISDNLRK